MQRRRRFLMGAGAFMTLEGLGLGLGCASDQTTGSFVTLETRVGLGGERTFESALGYRVTLRRAQVALASIRVIERHSLAQRAQTWLIPRAHAHPGHHHDQGHVLAEVSNPTVVDLLDGDRTLGVHEGVSGDVEFVVVGFFAARALSGFAARLEGTVTGPEGEADFVAELSVDDLADPDSQLPEVWGCPFEGGAIHESGIVQGTLSPSRWLDDVDFAEASPGAQGPLLLAPETPPYTALVRGVRNAGAYAFSHSPQ